MTVAVGFVFFDDDLEWEPLEMMVRATPTRHRDVMVGEFMWMGAADLVDGRRVHQYEHRDTRRNPRIDEHGHAYCLVGDDYVPHASSGDAIADLRYRFRWMTELSTTFPCSTCWCRGSRLVP